LVELLRRYRDRVAAFGYSGLPASPKWRTESIPARVIQPAIGDAGGLVSRSGVSTIRTVVFLGVS
jgi:hypothetical protein